MADAHSPSFTVIATAAQLQQMRMTAGAAKEAVQKKGEETTKKMNMQRRKSRDLGA